MMKHFPTQAELTNAVVIATTTFPSLLLGLIGVVWLAVGKLIIVALRAGRKAMGLYHPTHTSPAGATKVLTSGDEHTAP